MSSLTYIEEIGSGGFGVVDKVKNASGEVFARKTFRPDPTIPTLAHDKLRKRFKREVMTQQQLGGREVVPVLDAELDGSKPWFLMPLADKSYDVQILEDRQAGKIDINAIADILNALEFIHDLGYVHRDLNPKNILKFGEHWKLSDLGAILPPSGQTVTLTEGTVIYTEQYCAPEQRDEFHKAQSSADVYAFGCILHDHFGTNKTRIPYAKQSALGPVGILIEKCTEPNSARRPSIRVLREMLLETLVELDGSNKVADPQSEEWLQRLQTINQWNEKDFGDFARFFAHLDVNERVAGKEYNYVETSSTPFLTRLTSAALANLAARKDGVANAILEKYCEWSRTTAFAFHFADTVCGGLVAIYDHADAATKAMALTALVNLGFSHNRWYVMKCVLTRCTHDKLTPELAKRVVIEIKTEEYEYEFKRCVNEVKWDVSTLHPEVAKLLA